MKIILMSIGLDFKEPIVIISNKIIATEINTKISQPRFSLGGINAVSIHTLSSIRGKVVHSQPLLQSVTAFSGLSLQLPVSEPGPPHSSYRSQRH